MAEAEMAMTSKDNVATRLAALNAEIETIKNSSPASAASVTLVAVSKMHPQSAAREALLSGHRVFGENRVQEAQQKFPELQETYPDLSLHLIGPLQTNKVREAVALFDVIETVDRPRLAGALAKELARSDRQIEIMIQVNTGEESQKAGIPPRDADAFIEECREIHHLPVCGLMCIPPIDEEPAMHFALLAEMARRNGIPQISMGMSADYEAAIRLGATHVRIGTAIFGSRPAA